MNYTTLGRSGLRVSPHCLGAMTFGADWGWGAEPAVCNDMMDHFLEHGGNFIDTANMYTKGHAEKIIGDHIGGVPSKRDRVVLATKFSGNLYPGDPNGGGASRKSIMAAVENSLRRLQTDYIDLYWMHWQDWLTPIEETMRTLTDLVRQGKVRYIGFSDTHAYKIAEAQMYARYEGLEPIVALQIEYSLKQRTVEGELVPAALDLGLGITPWSPLAGGALTGKYRRNAENAETAGRGAMVTRNITEAVHKIVDVLDGVAAEAGCTVAQAALAWLHQKPGVASIILGARTVEQLDDDLKALDYTLTADQMARLDEASKPQLNFPYDFARATGPQTNGGSTINGVEYPVWALSPQHAEDRY